MRKVDDGGKNRGGGMSFIVATNVVASRLTGTLHARANSVTAFYLRFREELKMERFRES